MPVKAAPLQPLIRVASIINPRGLHARAAAKFVKLAEGFTAEISISHNNLTVSARSIMGLLMLGAAQGAAITIATSGEDAKVALDALSTLVGEGFGEL